MDDFIELSSENDNEIVDNIDMFIELFYYKFNSINLNKNTKNNTFNSI